MKKKIIVGISVLFCITFVTFSESTELESEPQLTVVSPWTFNVATDLAYYPDSDAIASDETHFAPITGPYSGLEARTTFHAVYTMPCVFSDNPLFSGNTLKLDTYLEATPVSISPGAKVLFTPIAFLQFSAGANVTAAWDFIGIQGLAEYNETPDEYDSFDSFTAYYKAWAQGMFQFDLAALVPGDWTHIVTMDSYQIYYEGVTAGNDGAWKYQGVGTHFSVPAYYSSLVVGYQTPALPVLNTVAVQTELTGLFNTVTIDDYYDNWDPSFMKISISPLAILNLSENDTLVVLLGFSSRRSFESSLTDDDATNFTLTSVDSAREWYFNRLALSWTHQL